MRSLYLIPILLLLRLEAIAQSNHLEDSLNRQLAHAVTISEKVYWLNKMADYYSGLNTPLAEQYENRSIELADSSRDRILMIRTMLYTADRAYSFTGLQQSILKGLEYSGKALEMARANNFDDYTAWSYCYLARGSRFSGKVDKAINYCNMAISMVASMPANDSLKVGVYEETGYTYLFKNENLLAFRHFLQAMNIAEQSMPEQYSLLKASYEAMGNFYFLIGDNEKAKDYVFKVLAVERKYNKPYDLVESYNFMGRIYTAAKQYEEGKKYYERSLSLIDSLKMADIFKVNAYINIVNLFVFSNQYEKSLEYFRTHQELNKFLTNSGLGYIIDQGYASLYTLVGKTDSAAFYFRKAAPAIEANAPLRSKYWFYSSYGAFYKSRQDHDQAIEWFMKAKAVAEQMSDLGNQQKIMSNLDTLYQNKGDFKTAYTYNSLYHRYTDSLEKLSKEKDLLQLEIANEQQRKERELRLQEEKDRRWRNIQYMGITIAIAGVFILLVMAGLFSVSKTTIRVLGFFAFIFFFEFIILLADNQIHHWTHGEPWKVLLIKIGLIAGLLPLHHWMEEKLIHYLTSHRMLKVPARHLIGRWFKKKEKQMPAGNL